MRRPAARLATSAMRRRTRPPSAPTRDTADARTTDRAPTCVTSRPFSRWPAAQRRISSPAATIAPPSATERHVGRASASATGAATKPERHAPPGQAPGETPGPDQRRARRRSTAATTSSTSDVVDARHLRARTGDDNGTHTHHTWTPARRPGATVRCVPGRSDRAARRRARPPRRPGAGVRCRRRPRDARTARSRSGPTASCREPCVRRHLTWRPPRRPDRFRPGPRARSTGDSIGPRVHAPPRQTDSAGHRLFGHPAPGTSAANAPVGPNWRSRRIASTTAPPVSLNGKAQRCVGNADRGQHRHVLVHDVAASRRCDTLTVEEARRRLRAGARWQSRSPGARRTAWRAPPT